MPPVHASSLQLETLRTDEDEKIEAGFELRTLRENRILEGLELCRLAGWNQVSADWHRLLKLEPTGCFGMFCRQQLVGTATTTRFGDELAWIGMVLVHPEFRRRGLATELLDACLKYLREKATRCIKLDATPTGQKVYEKLGFEVEWPFHRWKLGHRFREGNPESGQPNNQISSGGTFDVSANLMDGLCPDFTESHLQLDRLSFGTDRSNLIRRLSEGTTAEFSDDGYGLLRPGYLAHYLGPVVVSSCDAARTMILKLLRTTTRDIFWDIPSPNSRAVMLAEELGFTPVRKLIRMRLGPQPRTPSYEWQYAMFDPSVG